MLEVSIRKQLGTLRLDAKLEGSGFILLTGKNGAGKTSLLRCISGIYQPDEGSIVVNARDVVHLPPQARATVLVDQNTYFSEMNVADHMAWGAKARGVRLNKTDVNQVSLALGVPQDKKVGELSTGQRVKVALMTAALSGAEVILVDEALSNVSDSVEFAQSMKEMGSQRGFDLVVASQDSGLKTVCDAHFEIENGVVREVA